MHIASYLIFCFFWGALALIRMYLTESTHLGWLVWNLILAFLPYLFALAFMTWKGIVRYFAFFFWLFFLPNSFYILTDFVHLYRFPEMIYYDIVYISSMAFAWMVSWYASLELMHKYWNIHYHKVLSWFFVIGTIVISIIGVYIGRFLRFNSWDIIDNPSQILHEVWLLILSNWQIWDIQDIYRASVSKMFEVGAMWLWQFTLLYSTFFLMVYAYLYHVKKH